MRQAGLTHRPRTLRFTRLLFESLALSGLAHCPLGLAVLRPAPKAPAVWVEPPWDEWIRAIDAADRRMR